MEEQPIDKEQQIEEQLAQLKLKFNELTKQHKDLHAEYKIIAAKFRATGDEKDKITKQIKNLQFSIETKSAFDMFGELDTLSVISKQEQIIIIKGMDKTDYTKYGKERWMDLNKIIDHIIKIKKEYPDWVLKNLIKTGQYDSQPPMNMYKYTFIAPNDLEFSWGFSLN